MKKTDSKTVKLSKEQKDTAFKKLQKYFSENFDLEIGSLQSELFMDFLSEGVGIFYYNKGVEDSMKYMEERVSDMFLLLKDEPESNFR